MQFKKLINSKSLKCNGDIIIDYSDLIKGGTLSRDIAFKIKKAYVEGPGILLVRGVPNYSKFRRALLP